MKPRPPSDLIDFYLRWKEFRPCMEELIDRNILTTTEKETIGWLMILAEKIGAQDIE